ncbi:MAG: hypothetical protein O2820_24975 [Planctomycetota bacterium]|nr:hypothetical protein [Planctomycetota bacterium]MDA1252467.1 hypothetical protein [Planctomycetota bacterium]
MAVIQQQIESFHRFAKSRAKDGDSDLTMDELYDLWRAENLPPEELAESLASLERGLADAAAGRIQPARDVIDELRNSPGTGSA